MYVTMHLLVTHTIQNTPFLPIIPPSRYHYRLVKLPPSRTVTFLTANAVPTQDMYLYAARASVGDDVYHEPCTKALEAHMAKITGKEAALFIPSGTMSNQIALRTHLKQPPYAVLCDHRAHIVRCVLP